MAKKLTRYGPDKKYLRRRVTMEGVPPHDVYGLTQAELEQNVLAYKAQMAAQQRSLEDPYVYEYAPAFYSRKEPGLSASGKETYRHQINDVICPVIGSLRMSEVTTDDIADVMATVGGLSRSSQKKTVMVLKQIFDAALDAGKITMDPCRKLKAGGKPPTPKTALTEAEQKTLLEAVRGTKAELFCNIALYAGLRKEEVCGLLWDSVELDAAAPHLIVRRAVHWPTRSQPQLDNVLKTQAAYRTIPIPAKLVTVLKAEKEKALRKCSAEELRSRPVLANQKGTVLSYSGMQSLWGQVRARSTESGRAMGEKSEKHPDVVVTIDFKVTPHLLRHTYITRLILGGVDLKRVQYLAGHSDPAVTLEIYTSLMGHAPEDLIDDVRGVFDD